MKNSLIFILFLIFTSTIVSCGRSSKNQIDFTIEDNELGLVFTKNKRIILDSGEHRIDKESKVILFNKVDSLTMEDFDILDSNVKSLYCQAKVKYSLTAKHIENIADLLEWIHSIKSYKDLVIVPEIRSGIRNIAEKYEAKDLKNDDYQHNEIEKFASNRLKKYADIVSLELKFYEK